MSSMVTWLNPRSAMRSIAMRRIQRRVASFFRSLSDGRGSGNSADSAGKAVSDVTVMMQPIQHCRKVILAPQRSLQVLQSYLQQPGHGDDPAKVAIGPAERGVGPRKGPAPRSDGLDQLAVSFAGRTSGTAA